MTTIEAYSRFHAARSTRLVAIVLASVCLASAVRADTNTSLGNRSGDGPNPFTGLAGAPEANLFTGALSTSIAIEVPPGRKNATPKLALEYSSSGGPSTFGYGWDLPIGRIEHATKWGVPHCDDAHFDEYVLMMSGTSVELVSDPPDSNTYRPKAEEAYVKAELDVTTDSWVVYDRAGMRYEFGKSSYARIGTNSGAFKHVEMDGTCTFTSAWALTKMRDPNGNTVDIGWFSLFNQLLPINVEYGGNDTLGTSHLYDIAFQYESRPDTVRSFRQGAPTRLAFRLNQIVVEAYIPSFQTVRSYDLFYDDTQPTRQSLLVAVAKTGMPTQAFTYTPSVTGHRAMCPDAGPCTVLPGPRTFLRKYTRTEGDVNNTVMDMNGDGILDFVSWNDGGATWTVNFGQFGTGNGLGFLDPVPWQRIFGYGDAIRNIVTDCPAAGGGICTKTDTIDITGDGIPDFVVGDSASEWHVYPGRRTSTGWGFAATEDAGAILHWATPQKWLRRVLVPPVNPDADGQATGTTVIQDLVDMNGDGLIDLVVAGTSPWLVYLNNGRGFDASPLLYQTPQGTAPPISDANNAFQHWGLMDFNGDGLPDILFYNEAQIPSAETGWCQLSSEPGSKLHDCLMVALNNGAGFDDFELNEVPGGYGYSRDENGQYYRELLDINGDGLPDFVDRPQVQVGNSWIRAAEWHVLLNLGGRLEPVSYYTSGIYQIAYISRIWPGLSGPIRQRTGQYDLIDMIDIDGDGLLDRVDTGSSTSWKVWLNRAGASSIDGGGPSQRPNVMATMSNGFGGTNTIVYRPSTAYDNTGGEDSAPDLPFPVWLVERTRRSDGMCATGPGDVFDPASNTCIAQGHDIVAKYRYRDGRFDPPSREFRGFRRVEKITEEAHVDDSQAAIDDVDTTEATEFEQLAATKGRMLSQAWYAGADCIGSQPEPDCRPPQIIRLSVNLWKTAPIGTPSADRSQVWLAQNLMWSLDPPGGGNFRLFVDNQPPDAYGNILESTKKDDSGKLFVAAHTDYALPQGGATPIYNRPNHSWTWDSNGLLQEQWFYYDGRQDNTVANGNVTDVRSRLDANTSSSIDAYTTYDGFGNVLSVTDGNGNPTATAYDAYNLHPLKITNALNHASDILSRDYRFGTPTAERDPNGAIHRYTYDAAGRKQCEARPGEDIAQCPISYEYHFAGPGETLSYIKVSESQPPRPGSGCGPSVPRPPLWRKESFDALGRVRQRDTFQVVEGTATSVRTSETVYDAAGRVSRVFQPHVAGAAPAWTDAERFDYHLEDTSALWVDPLGRIHSNRHPDGKTRWTRYQGTETDYSDEENNLSYDIHDALGRVIRSVDLISQSGSSQTDSVTDYTYDGLGRLLEIRQNNSAAALRAMTYDLLGRRLTLLDLDSGLWRYAYDGAGNVVAEDDPKPNQQIQTCYDKLNRPIRHCVWSDDSPQTHSCANACPAANASEQVTYAYDGDDGWTVPYSKGRLTRVIDGSGQFDVVAYDVRGRQTQTKKTISAVGGAHSATFKYTYDTNDRLTAVTYPDGEVVKTDYDDSGQPQALYNGSYNYVLSAEYDAFGRLVELEHGNHIVDRRTYGSAAQGHRLTALSSAPTAGGPALLSLSYSEYDGRGFITRIDDQLQPSGERTNSTRFTYDHKGRLTNADSNYDSADRAYAYDAFGNIKRNGSSFFDYAGATHQATNIRTGSATGPVIGTIQHDANGSRTQAGTQQYTYTKGGRLETVAVGGSLSTFYYDFQGRKVARLIDEAVDVVTRYYGELAETTNGTLTKWYFLGGQRVAADNGATAWETAMVAPSNGSVWLANVRMDHPALVMVLTREMAPATAVGIVVVGTVLLLAPWRPQHSVRRRVRYGHIIGMLVVWNVATLPWPFLVAPEEAAAQPGTGRVHYHLDHLGSTQLVTAPNGTVVEEVRYSPYGEIRGRWGANGEETALYEFTGYETEHDSGLQYAGARFYDPLLGSFLTHDPVENFINPYSYVRWNPVNNTDPTGEFDLLGLLFTFLFVGGIVAPAVQAGINGANAGQAVEAALTGLVIGVGLQATVIGPLATAVGSAAPAVYAAQLAYGAYSTYEGFRSGQYVAAGFGATQLAFSLYGAFAQGADRSSLSQQEQRNFAQAEYDHRFGGSEAAQIDFHPWHMLEADLLDLAGGLYGTVSGIAKGMDEFGTGIAALDSGGIEHGLYEFGSALTMPRLGSAGGLNYPSSADTYSRLFESGSQPNNASIWHDSAVGVRGFMSSSSQFGWIKRVWTGPGIQPGLYGQTYRLLGTVGFGLAGTVQWGLGY